MLVPPHFRSPDTAAAWRAIDAHRFGTLVSAPGGSAAPVAASLPFLAVPVERKLIGHIARANPQLSLLRAPDPAPVLVVFQGPSGFVSGGFYDRPDALSTWNHWFGGQRFNYVPDLITTAKGLTSAYAPMGTLIVSDHVAAPFADGEHVFAHGLTFGGHPVAAVALANIEVLEREDLLGTCALTRTSCERRSRRCGRSRSLAISGGGLHLGRRAGPRAGDQGAVRAQQAHAHVERC